MKKEKKLIFTECSPGASIVHMLVHIILTEGRESGYFLVLRMSNWWLRRLINLINFPKVSQTPGEGWHPEWVFFVPSTQSLAHFI